MISNKPHQIDAVWIARHARTIHSVYYTPPYRGVYDTMVCVRLKTTERPQCGLNIVVYVVHTLVHKTST